jgi:addiction module RelB/DinJ family antitoxin
MGLKATVQFRINPIVKEEAFSVFNEMGISPSTAMQLFLQQVQKTRTLPFIITANHTIEEKEAGYDDWLRARLADTILKLDSGEMKTSSISDVKARLQAKRAKRQDKKPSHPSYADPTL